jgi:hypothetical protein
MLVGVEVGVGVGVITRLGCGNVLDPLRGFWMKLRYNGCKSKW